MTLVLQSLDRIMREEAAHGPTKALKWSRMSQPTGVMLESMAVGVRFILPLRTYGQPKTLSGILKRENTPHEPKRKLLCCCFVLNQFPKRFFRLTSLFYESRIEIVLTPLGFASPSTVCSFVHEQHVLLRFDLIVLITEPFYIPPYLTCRWTISR